MENLKCCPWCGGEAEIREIEGHYTPSGQMPSTYYVDCSKCGAEAPNDGTLEEAIASWNTRVKMAEGWNDCVSETKILNNL